LPKPKAQEVGTTSNAITSEEPKRPEPYQRAQADQRPSIESSPPPQNHSSTIGHMLLKLLPCNCSMGNSQGYVLKLFSFILSPALFTLSANFADY
jgi:hypothetical protein